MDIELVVFDWSGTIIDDRRLVYETIAKILRGYSKELEPFDQWLSSVSTNTTNLVLSDFFFKRHGIEFNDRNLKQLWETNLSEIVSNGIKSVSYPDTSDVFKYLTAKGKKIAVVSYQPESHILKEAQEHGLSQFITRVNGFAFDKSAHLINLCKELNIKPENALFVGDMTLDVQAAKKAAIASVAITTGYHSRDVLLGERPDYVISSLSELKDII